MKLLIAEDNQDLRLITGDLIASWGYDFDMASNGKEAVDYALKNKGEYDLCLMDIQMPIMNGIEATKIIRRKVKYFPILALSASPRYRDECIEAGMDDFVEKSCFFDKILAKLNEFTIKSIKFEYNDNSISIKKDMPMDKDHAQELRELAKKNLRKVKFFDSPGKAIIVHKNVTNKISYDFNVNKQLVSTFINRDPEKPTRCELYKESNYLMPQTFLAEEEYDDLIKAENNDLEKHTKLFLKENEK